MLGQLEFLAWEFANWRMKKQWGKSGSTDFKILSDDNCFSKFMVNLPMRPNDTW